MRLVACPRCHLQYDVTAHADARFDCACGTSVDATPAPGHDATVRRCSACGAGVEAGARACPYCRAGLVADATRLRLICPECFARNDEAAKFCAACGVEFRPQPVPEESRALSCPECAQALQLQGVGGVPVRECARCAGLWVPGDHFDALVGHVSAASDGVPTRGLALVSRPPAAGPGDASVRYRACPSCAQPMHRKNFGRRSGIIVDWCREHGTWLDAGELEGVAKFVRSGALAKSERDHAESIQAEARAAMDAARGVERVPSWPTPPWVSNERQKPMNAGALIGAFLRELVRK